MNTDINTEILIEIKNSIFKNVLTSVLSGLISKYSKSLELLNSFRVGKDKFEIVFLNRLKFCLKCIGCMREIWYE